MITAGLVHALVAWATGNTERIAQLTAERDALIAGILGAATGKATSTLTSGSLNGKSFTFLTSLSREDKLTVLTGALEALGEIDARPSITFADFREATR